MNIHSGGRQTQVQTLVLLPSIHAPIAGYLLFGFPVSWPLGPGEASAELPMACTGCSVVTLSWVCCFVLSTVLGGALPGRKTAQQSTGTMAGDHQLFSLTDAPGALVHYLHCHRSPALETRKAVRTAVTFLPFHCHSHAGSTEEECENQRQRRLFKTPQPQSDGGGFCPRKWFHSPGSSTVRHGLSTVPQVNKSWFTAWLCLQLYLVSPQILTHSEGGPLDWIVGLLHSTVDWSTHEFLAQCAVSKEGLDGGGVTEGDLGCVLFPPPPFFLPLCSWVPWVGQFFLHYAISALEPVNHGLNSVKP